MSISYFLKQKLELSLSFDTRFKCLHHVYAKQLEQLQLLVLQATETDRSISRPQIVNTHNLYLTIELIITCLSTL